MDIYDKIEYLIKYNNISRKDMCQGANIGYGTYTSMFNRRSERILMDTIISISIFFNVTVDYLMDDNIPIEPILYKNNSNIQAIVSKDKQILLNSYDKLNSLGKNEAKKRIDELTQIEKYTIDNVNIETKKEQIIIKEFPKQDEEERVQIIARGKGITTISKEEYDRIMETAQEIDNIDDYF